MENILKKLIDLTKKKIENLKQLYDLTEKIGVAIGSNDLEELKKLLVSKQQIIEKINEIDKDFIPLYNAFKKENKIESIFEMEDNVIGDASKLKGLFIDAKALLDKIKEKDDSNIKEINKVFEKVSDKLEEFSKNKEGYVEYLRYYTPESYFIDKKR
ncbi:FlgN family protein [Caldanaerobacter subterraneus subsp. yonseiensis KB-1]|uniref:FlgN family protein n=1 Tax=Caldanaerobacter subterraneus subsp. yonseiensis KB-1 TaxID=1388761 RepID=U5CPQ9_CALSX|nr:flagellar export chaperone FlgN [Caldanaerobacter subterraneus]ERM91764.1 FlgN family protein [Caldanaerobacter subterraneus subsp. yonseiensis KB-1]